MVELRRLYRTNGVFRVLFSWETLGNYLHGTQLRKNLHSLAVPLPRMWRIITESGRIAICWVNLCSNLKITIVNRLLIVHIWLCLFYYLRRVSQYFIFGICDKLMAHLILVLKSRMEWFIEKSWPFHSCFIDWIGRWKLTTLTTNRAQAMFIPLLHNRSYMALTSQTWLVEVLCKIRTKFYSSPSETLHYYSKPLIVSSEGELNFICHIVQSTPKLILLCHSVIFKPSSSLERPPHTISLEPHFPSPTFSLSPIHYCDPIYPRQDTTSLTPGCNGCALNGHTCTLKYYKDSRRPYENVSYRIKHERFARKHAGNIELENVTVKILVTSKAAASGGASDSVSKYRNPRCWQ